MARVATPAASHTSAVVTQSRAFGSLTGHECSWTGRNQLILLLTGLSEERLKELGSVEFRDLVTEQALARVEADRL